jgi:hypothetical protein
MRWMMLALVLVAGCGDDDSAPEVDAGPCMELIHYAGDTSCQPCSSEYTTDAGTCNTPARGEVPCYYDPHCGGWGDAG